MRDRVLDHLSGSAPPAVCPWDTETMPDDILRHAIAEVGCDAHDQAGQIDCLERILSNLHDPRRTAALRVAETLTIRGGDHALRLQGMVARARRLKAQPAREVFRTLTNPEDPRWRDALETLIGAGRDPATAWDFADALLTTWDNRLRSTDEAGRQHILLGQRSLLVAVVVGLGDILCTSGQLRLKRWIAEADQLQLTELLTTAERERSAVAWEAVAAQALAAESSSATDAQAETADATLALATEHQHWRTRFERLLAQIAVQHTVSTPVLPWAPPTTPDQPPLETTPEEVAAVLTGLGRHGAPADLTRWQSAIEVLFGTIIERICLDNEQPPDLALTGLERLRAQWSADWGPLPLLARWESVEAGLLADLERLAGGWVATLRAGFSNLPALREAIAGHARLSAASARCTAPMYGLERDMQAMATIESEHAQWWESGDTAALDDGRFMKLKDRIDALRPDWGASVGFADYLERNAALGAELTTLSESIQDLERDDAARALTRLEGCQSPAAELLRERALQSDRDRRVSALIDQGLFEQISVDNLATASDALRSRHAAALRGRAFVESWRGRCTVMPGNTSTAVVRDAMALLAEAVPDKAELVQSDAAAMAIAREALGERIRRDVRALADELAKQLRRFPPMEAGQLRRITADEQALTGLLALPGFDDWEVRAIEDRLRPLRVTCAVQRHVLACDWDAAAAALATPDAQTCLDRQAQRELRATIGSARLAVGDGREAGWLALYQELPDVLLKDGKAQARYLALLRRTGGGATNTAHVALLGRVPEAATLRTLLAGFANPSELADLSVPLGSADEPVLSRLLDCLTQQPRYYHALKRLWMLLPPDQQGRVWRTGTPLDAIEAVMAREQVQIEADLYDPAVTINALRERLEVLLHAGRPAPQLAAMLETAGVIDACLGEWERLDPWGDDLRVQFEETHRRLDAFAPAILNARGWRAAVESRRAGVTAWRELTEAWALFQPSFAARFTGFHLNPDAWGGFRDLLGRWVQSLALALPRMDWTLPRADTSKHWQHLLKAWVDAPEGQLWQADRRPPPPNLNALRDAYVKIDNQINDFADLHARLLNGTTDALLEQLHLVRPLSRPVRDIRQQLTNLDVAPDIAKAYRHFLDRQELP